MVPGVPLVAYASARLRYMLELRPASPSQAPASFLRDSHVDFTRFGHRLKTLDDAKPF